MGRIRPARRRTPPLQRRADPPVARPRRGPEAQDPRRQDWVPTGAGGEADTHRAAAGAEGSEAMITRSTAVLACADVQNTVDYYCNTLGFKQHWLWEDPPTFAAIGMGDVEI